ncbi:MAG: hypothetical protein ACLPN6_14995 [Streptosporangiaceae bacterium]|jgi:hypothetical protein|nr:hypothetical protein [Actinomycetota bacterium]
MTMTSATPAGEELEYGSRLAARRSVGLQECALCGVQLPRASMVPDGGPACPDVRWYCADMSSCTRRWTARRRAAMDAALAAAAAERDADGSARAAAS